MGQWDRRVTYAIFGKNGRVRGGMGCAILLGRFIFGGQPSPSELPYLVGQAPFIHIHQYLR